MEVDVQEFSGLLLLIAAFLLILLVALSAFRGDEYQDKVKRRVGLTMCICFFLALFFASMGSARAETYISRTPTRAEYIIARVAHADKLCSEQELSFITEEGKATNIIERKDKKGRAKKQNVVARVNKIVARPVYLCAFKESDHSWHVVKVFVKYPVPKTFVKFPAWVATEGYEIEHVRGRGVTRLSLNLIHNGERLTIYRYRHAWFTKDPQKNSAHEVIASAKATNYTPYHPDFDDSELRDMGMKFLGGELDIAFRELKDAEVVSRAFPSKLVSDVIHAKHPLILAAIEQTDDGRFLADPSEAINAVFIEYALNREHSFSWSVSSANAIGAMQFTNKNGNGTYDLVVRNYPKAALHADFEEGTRDLRNVLKAAICLLDLELGQLREVQTLYVNNPKIGGVYPIAAYNEGGGGARQLYQLVNRHNIDIEQEEDLPSNLFERIRKKFTSDKKKKRGYVKKVMNNETYMYIKKYMYVWNYFDVLLPQQ